MPPSPGSHGQCEPRAGLACREHHCHGSLSSLGPCSLCFALGQVTSHPQAGDVPREGFTHILQVLAEAVGSWVLCPSLAQDGACRWMQEVRELCRSGGARSPQQVGLGGFQETSFPLLPFHCSSSLHPSWLLQLPSLAVPSRVDRNLHTEGERSVGVGGGIQQTPPSPSHPLALPLSCSWQPQIRDERLMGQIFVEVTSSTWASPKQPRQLLALYPMANIGHPSPYFAPGERAHHRHGNVPMSHQLQAGRLALIL